MTGSSADLLAEMLAKPIGNQHKPGPSDAEYTKRIEVTESAVTATLRGEEGEATEDTARDFLEDEGLDPARWEVASFRKSEWGSSDKPMESVSFTFKKRGGLPEREPLDIDDLIERALAAPAVDVAPLGEGDYGYLVLIADLQAGKVDADGVEGSFARIIQCINRAADRLISYREHFPISHVHIAWLGDHIEGFISQNGDSAWRTELSLTEQIRLVRRAMLYALEAFAPMADKVTMVAVPGNHDQAVRFGKGGVTRYDDSHDCEALIAVHDAARFNRDAFGHVEFMVPETDELVVVTEVAGTVVAHAHGHQWKPGRHFDWWKGQAFDKTSAMHDADLLVAGHLHHEYIDTDGPRTFIQVPAMEKESTWWRHRTGTRGAPGLIVALTKDGQTDIKEVIR